MPFITIIPPNAAMMRSLSRIRKILVREDTRDQLATFLDLTRKISRIEVTQELHDRVMRFYEYTKRLLTGKVDLEIWSDWFLRYTTTINDQLRIAIDPVRNRSGLTHLPNHEQAQLKIENLVLRIAHLESGNSQNYDAQVVCDKIEDLLESFEDIHPLTPLRFYQRLEAFFENALSGIFDEDIFTDTRATIDRADIIALLDNLTNILRSSEKYRS